MDSAFTMIQDGLYYENYCFPLFSPVPNDYIVFCTKHFFLKFLKKLLQGIFRVNISEGLNLNMRQGWELSSAVEHTCLASVRPCVESSVLQNTKTKPPQSQAAELFKSNCL